MIHVAVLHARSLRPTARSTQPAVVSRFHTPAFAETTMTMRLPTKDRRVTGCYSAPRKFPYIRQEKRGTQLARRSVETEPGAEFMTIHNRSRMSDDGACIGLKVADSFTYFLIDLKSGRSSTGESIGQPVLQSNPIRSPLINPLIRLDSDHGCPV